MEIQGTTDVSKNTIIREDKSNNQRENIATQLPGLWMI